MDEGRDCRWRGVVLVILLGTAYSARAGLSTSVWWSATGEHARARFGSALSSAGDVNADGFADLLVGAEDFTGAVTNQGAAYLYFGSTNGFGTSQAWRVTGEKPRIDLGYRGTGIGDINGDGYDDVAVAAPFYIDAGEFPANSNLYIGRVYVHHGSPTGLGTVADWRQDGHSNYNFLGVFMSGGGDVNGDGYSDFLLGQWNTGAVHVFHGSATGLGHVANWYFTNVIVGEDTLDATYAGDINGDGHDDVMVLGYQSPTNGHVYLFSGSTNGLATTSSWNVAVDRLTNRLSVGIAGPGDLNGDGYDDVIVRQVPMTGAVTSDGIFSVYYGSASGLASSSTWTSDVGNALQAAVEGAGDVNGDGYGDIIAYKGTTGSVGTVSWYGGSLDGLRASALATFDVGTTGAAAQRTVARLGDVDGDGFGDVAVGGQGPGLATNLPGFIHIFRGTGLVLRIDAATVTNGSARTGWESVSGAVVQVERSSSLLVPAWTNISGPVTSTTAFTIFDAPGAATNEAVSYRLRWVAAP